MNADLNSVAECVCVWEGCPSLGLGGIRGGMVQSPVGPWTLVLGVTDVLIRNTGAFLLEQVTP